MSRPPSSARGIPSASASVPASQNTAPVIKFRCLFTHDIRRKAKRWQDGYLKFHTFNKRAMVYDDAGNFIGDHHWRDSNVIQDGDELELDKGVLIQVSECMETTQTDLSALFEKRKASQDSPQQERSSSALPSSRTPLAPRTAPLKSLNDLLGIKRPSIGRAIPPQSPYEQRHSSPARPPIQQQDGPPAKRQKQQPSAPPSRPVIAQRDARNTPEVIEIGDPDLQTQWEKRVPRRPLVRRRSNDVNGHQQSRDGASEPALSHSTIAQREKSDTQRVTASSRNNPQLESANPDSHISVPATTAQAPREKTQSQRMELNARGANVPLNPLRMSMEKPRPKLMYKARPLKVASSSTTETAQASSHQSFDGPLLTQSNSDFAISASTLAILESIDDDGSLRSAGGIRNTDPSARENVVSKQSTSQSLRTTALYQIPSHSAIYGSAASPAGLELSDDDSLSPSPVSIEPNNETAHTDGHTPVRSHSDLSSMLPEVQPTVSAANPQASECKGTEDPVPAARRSDAKTLRKSYSDTSALRNADQHRHGPSLPVATGRPARMDSIPENDKGPWTAEASDFFNWWPPGRPRP